MVCLTGGQDDIITQNGYAYANNNLVMFVDPDGHYFGAIAGGGFGLAKKGYRVVKVGMLKKPKAKGRGYPGIVYKGKRKTEQPYYKSIEIHTPLNSHGWHIQKNKFSKKPKEKLRHGGSKGAKRYTFLRSRNWKKR